MARAIWSGVIFSERRSSSWPSRRWKARRWSSPRNRRGPASRGGERPPPARAGHEPESGERRAPEL